MTEKTKVDMTNARAMFDDMVEGGKLVLAKLDTRISWVSGVKSKFDAIIHAAAVGAIAASKPHDQGGHDCPLRAERLLNAMPRGSRAKTLADWFEAFSNLRPKMDKSKGVWTVKNLPKTSKLYVPTIDVEAAFAKPFYSVDEKTNGAAAFDIGAIIGQLIKGYEKASEEGALDAETDGKIVSLIAFARNSGLPTAKAKPVLALAA